MRPAQNHTKYNFPYQLLYLLIWSESHNSIRYHRSITSFLFNYAYHIGGCILYHVVKFLRSCFDKLELKRRMLLLKHRVLDSHQVPGANPLRVHGILKMLSFTVLFPTQSHLPHETCDLAKVQIPYSQEVLSP